MDPYPLSIGAAVVVAGSASVYTWSRARSRTRTTESALPAPVVQPTPAADLESAALRAREESELSELVQVLPVLNFDTSRAVALPLHGALAEAVGTMSSMLGGAISALPATLPGAHGKLYELHFKPSITQKLADGTLHLQQAIGGGHRAGAVGANGRYAAQGRLIEAGRAGRKSAALMAASFQVLTFLVSQEHLAEANAKLAAIAQSIDGLRRERQIEREAEIAAYLNRLKEDVELLLRGELSEAEQSKVLDRLRAGDELCDKLEHLVVVSLAELADHLRTVSTRQGGFKGLSRTSESINGLIDRLSTWRRLDILAANLATYMLQVSCALSVDDKHAPARLERLRQQLDRNDGDFRGRVVLRAERDLKSPFSTKNRRREHHVDAWIRVKAVEGQFEATREQLIERFAQIEEALERKAAAQRDGVRMIVEVGPDGDVLRAFRVGTPLPSSPISVGNDVAAT